jgi:5-methyltetrahydropteroyltriglutamate--homocysteine methyltransferase
MSARVLTAVVGSYPQPDWLVDRSLLRKLMAPRVRSRQIWRVAEPFLAEAQNDATLVAIREQEKSGVDIISDGEIRRESYSNRFANALGGIDPERQGEIIGRTGNRIPVPLVTGPIERLAPVERADVEFLRANTDRRIKITLPGPFTMTQQAVNEYYRSDESLAFAYADAVNAEVHDLFAAGADVVQIDEPYMQARPEKARQYGIAAIEGALEGVKGTTALHICFGYAAIIHERPNGYSFLPELAAAPVKQISIETAQSNLDCSILEKIPQQTIILGVLDLSTHEVETPEVVAERIRRALPYIDAKRLVIAPDCGLKYLPRDVAFGKMKAMADGARLVRESLKV